ncbi:hypothetical protein HAX54_017086 [Datura stramonium]|uniref:Uncharacterized protein n=1 Tax=Datura stramonium TaxID=4076 RepID=A0ABS8UK83_DATST|nr:hypothetical protein [Datura stramonium]
MRERSTSFWRKFAGKITDRISGMFISSLEYSGAMKLRYPQYGETLQCPIKLAEIYGDQSPWQIFGASQEKIGYFISPLKKRKESDERENNIPKQNFVVCRIKKNIKQLKDIAVNYTMEEHVVADIIKGMLLGPDAYCTIQVPARDQVMEETDQWDSIIDRVCDDEQADKVEKCTGRMI